MSAPLYSRFKRYMDRDLRLHPKQSRMRQIIPLWKRPDTRVYSLSARASYEAGWWSTMEPGELLRAISLHYMPMPQLWIEFDWKAYNKGSNRIAWDDDRTPLTAKGHPNGQFGIRTWDEGSPVRMGCMLYQPGKEKARIAFASPELTGETYMGFLYYLYPNGSCFTGPPILGWHQDAELKLPMKAVISNSEVTPISDKEADKWMYEETGIHMDELALGQSYCERYGSNQPRLLKKLKGQTILSMVGAFQRDTDRKLPWGEIQGSTRIGISLLTAALSAKVAAYERREGTGEGRAPVARSERDRPIEVNLFIRERPNKPGHSLRASVGHLEGVKKGLHTVGAHYAYRSRKDGGDPTVCTHLPEHDWEEIEGTKSQVCVACNQKRWFKDRHQRGDEQYGIIPPKTYNIRTGSE